MYAVRAVTLVVALLLASLAGVMSSSRPAVAAEKAAPAPFVLAMKNGEIQLAYELFWGGFRIGVLDSRARIGEADYDLTFRFRTGGMLAWWVDGRNETRSTGRVLPDGAPRPVGFESRGLWNGERRRLAVAFAPDGRMSGLEVEPLRPDEREPVPEAMRQGPDPVALLVAIARNPMASGGSGESAVFDGRRVVQFRWRCGGREMLAPTLGSPFAGEALRCAVSGSQLAGFHKKYRSSNLELTEPATLWFAAVPGTDLHMPVRLVMDTQYGGLMAYVTRLGPAPEM